MGSSPEEGNFLPEQSIDSTTGQRKGISILGVRLSFLNKFVEQCGGRYDLQHLTTAEVCEKFVKTRADPTVSVCEQLSNQTPPIIGPAQWFISHCWQNLFLDVVDTIITFFRVQNLSVDTFVWFDLFSLPQHGRSRIATDWLQTTFTDAISRISNLLMVLTPWNAPLALTRAWCVYELYTCVKTDSNLHIALPPQETRDSISALAESTEAFYRTVLNIKSENSSATEKDDLIAIKLSIQQSIGFPALDRIISSVLLEWMIRASESRLSLMDWDGHRVDQARAMAHLAMLYTEGGRYTESERLWVDFVQRLKTLCGENDRETLTSVGHLARLYVKLGKEDEAQILLLDRLERTKKVLGEFHDETFSSIVDVVHLYTSQGKLDTAERLFRDVLDKMGEVTGQDNWVVVAMNGLATVYRGQRKMKMAESLYLDAWEKAERNLGEDHPNTLITIFNLASHYYSQWNLEQAERLFVTCLEGCSRALGENHPHTRVAMEELLDCYKRRGKYAEAHVLEERMGKRSGGKAGINDGAAVEP
ncbi:Kinesin light chain 3 [Rhizophlyctis rosea]|nr:Kinesin light chain 3 [Rhizophlyctis rosea]